MCKTEVLRSVYKGRYSKLRFFHLPILLGAVALFNIQITPIPAFADETPVSESNQVRVFVRTIQASDPLDANAVADHSVAVDQNLSDLRVKLSSLPFKSFRLISSKEEDLCLRRKETMHLPNGQSLAFRPMYMDEQRVGLWLSWKDESGSDILNTRIHFNTADSVLTGTDASPDTGLILAIKAVPIERPGVQSAGK